MISFFNRIKQRPFIFTALFFICSVITAQQTYFQQEVNYKIDVSLNDKNHTLNAFEEIKYVNNSSQGLSFIYFHLWPNAYKDNNTALAKQLLSQGKTTFYFSKPEERGYIDSLDFKVNGKSVKWEYDAQHIDICKLILNEPLRSLDTAIITTPFFVKIPDAKFSRLGHTGQAYFMTQWFPKPAVFDNQGWHAMPYLDQGEFFSEFGSFDVKITLPENYMLAATGDRIDAEAEEERLNNNVILTINRMERNDFRESDMSFPESSSRLKTVRFKQFRVHDFAWFADKRFNVLHDQIELPNTKRVVDTWVFFTNKNFKLWKEAITYVNESTIFYSYLNGDYPYNHVTAVDGTIMAGGGMEYPNITVIGDMDNALDLDITIAHEVGHNWFYGILGSNERDYPGMDEGINSFYELRYIRAKYPAKRLTEYLGRDSTFKFIGVNKIPYWREKETGYFYSAKSGSDQAINNPSQEFTPTNYGTIVYAKTAVVFDYLMDYMGEENFDKAMQFYYEQFKFKHPSPSDLTKTLSYFSGIDLNWFTQYLIAGTDKIDYKIKSVKRNADGSYTLKVKNKTGVPVPINIYGFKDNKAHGLIWFDGFKGTKTIGFPASEIDYFKIDGLDRMPDVNRKNNVIRTKGIFKKSEPLQINFITQFENPKYTQINWVPLVGANFYDGPMLGLAVHNYGIYDHKFEYMVAPMFGFRSLMPVGFAEFNYKIHPKKVFREIAIGTKIKSFDYDMFKTETINSTIGTHFDNLFFNYKKIAPHINFELKKKHANDPITQHISYTSNFILIDSLDTKNFATTITTSGPRKKTTSFFVNELTYNLTNSRVIDPYSLNLSLQHNDKIAKLSGTFNYKFTITKKHSFDVRLFGGTFLSKNENDNAFYSFRASGYNGYQDYLFNDNFIARNEFNGLGFSQFSEQDGNLKVWTPLGQSPYWLASVNLKSPKLFILPIKIYADAVFTDERSLLNDKFLWSAGANITIWKDIIDVYIPFAYSNDIQKTLDINNIDFWHRIRFTLNLHKLAPKDYFKNNLF